jgi:hypothetical protein
VVAQRSYNLLMDKGAATCGYLVFAVYTAIRVGWIAPASRRALTRGIGPCGRIEAALLMAALVALPVIIWSS